MGVNTFPPKRGEPITERRGLASYRAIRFFEEVSRAIGGLPEQGAAVADIGALVAPTANETILRAKINELLGSLRTAGVLET